MRVWTPAAVRAIKSAMDVWTLLPAPLGVGLIVVLVWLLGGWRDALIADAGAARARYLDDDPLFEPGDVLLSADGRAALVFARSGTAAALLRVLGDRQITRSLAGGMLRSVALAGEDDGRTCLRLGLADPTCRKAAIDVTPLPDAERRTWLARLEELAPPASAAT